MVGVVFGQRTGVAPGLEGSLSYKRLSFYSSAEYVFDVKSRDKAIFSTRGHNSPTLQSTGFASESPRNTPRSTPPNSTPTTAPKSASATNAYDFTSYILNPHNPIVILELGASF